MRNLMERLEKNTDRVVAAFVVLFAGWLAFTSIGLLLGLIEPSAKVRIPPPERNLVWSLFALISSVAIIASIGLFFRKSWAYLIFGCALLALCALFVRDQEWIALAFCGTLGLAWISEGLSKARKRNEGVPPDSRWSVNTYKSLADYDERHAK